MSFGTFVLGGHDEVEIDAITLEWRQIWFHGTIQGPQEERTWRGLDILAPDGSLLYRDVDMQVYCYGIGANDHFALTYSLNVPSPEPRQRNKGTVRERRRKVTAAEAWEG